MTADRLQYDWKAEKNLDRKSKFVFAEKKNFLVTKRRMFVMAPSFIHVMLDLQSVSLKITRLFVQNFLLPSLPDTLSSFENYLVAYSVL